MAAPRKTSKAEDKKVVSAYKKGTPVAEITDTFGISAGTVRSIVVRAGVPLRPVGRPKTKA